LQITEQYGNTLNHEMKNWTLECFSNLEVPAIGRRVVRVPALYKIKYNNSLYGQYVLLEKVLDNYHLFYEDMLFRSYIR
jgi:hypothetical protein